MKKVKKDHPVLAFIVGRNIQAARKIKGLTQNELAQMLGVETETISRYERGVLAPSFPQIEKICASLDTQAWVLFSDDAATPDVRTLAIIEMMKSLPLHAVDYLLSTIRLYIEHHRHQ